MTTFKDFFENQYLETFQARGAGNSEKTPLLMDHNEDWKFLSQFPPFLWAAALHWRYSAGLCLASQEREKGENLDDESLPDYWDKIILKQGNKEYEFTNQGKGMYVGYKTLFKKLEKPVKHKGDMTNIGIHKFEPGPGVHDINLDDPEDIKKYTHGVHDFDLTDCLGDDEQRRFKGFKPIQSDVANSIINVLKNGQALGLLGDVPDQIKNPVTGQMEKVEKLKPSQISSHWTKEDDYVGKNDDLKFKGINDTGEEDVEHSSHSKELKNPAIKTHIKYKVNGKDEEYNAYIPVFNSGTLLPTFAGKHLDKSVALTPSQREAIQKRLDVYPNEKRITKMLDSLINLDPSIKTPEMVAKIASLEIPKNDQQKEEKRQLIQQIIASVNPNTVPGQQKKDKIVKDIANVQKLIENPKKTAETFQTILNLVKNPDLISKHQWDHLMKNQRKEIHALAQKTMGSDFKKKYPNDKWSGNPMILGGFSPNELNKRSSIMPQEHMKEIEDKYLGYNSKALPARRSKWGKPMQGGLMGEAEAGIDQYLIDTLGWQKDKINKAITNVEGDEQEQKQIQNKLTMMLKHKPELVAMQAMLLLSRLNDPAQGIYDPKLGLTVADPDSSEENSKNRQEDSKRNFANSFAQASLDDEILSRRKAATAKRLGISNTGTFSTAGGSGSSLDTDAAKAKKDLLGMQDDWEEDKPEQEKELARKGWNISGRGVFQTFRDKQIQALKNAGIDAETIKKQISIGEYWSLINSELMALKEINPKLSLPELIKKVQFEMQSKYPEADKNFGEEGWRSFKSRAEKEEKENEEGYYKDSDQVDDEDEGINVDAKKHDPDADTGDPIDNVFDDFLHQRDKMPQLYNLFDRQKTYQDIYKTIIDIAKANKSANPKRYADIWTNPIAQMFGIQPEIQRPARIAATEVPAAVAPTNMNPHEVYKYLVELESKWQRKSPLILKTLDSIKKKVREIVAYYNTLPISHDKSDIKYALDELKEAGFTW